MFALIITALGVLFFLVYRWLPEGSLPAPVLGGGGSGLTWSRILMSILVSLAILASGLYIILSQAYGGAEQKWAFGAVGTVVGFWLRPSSS